VGERKLEWRGIGSMNGLVRLLRILSVSALYPAALPVVGCTNAFRKTYIDNALV